MEVTLTTRPAEPPRTLLTAGFFGDDVEEGIKVTRLLAEDSNLQEGDVVTLLDGKQTQGFRETLQQLSQQHNALDKVKATVIRGDATTVGELTRPASQSGRRRGRRPATAR